MAKIDELKKNLEKIMKHFGVAKKEIAPKEDEAIRVKYNQLRRKQLADSLKADDRTAHIKSAGNGL